MDAYECYTRSQLNDYLLGQMPEDQIGQISEHLDHCGICEETVVGLDAVDDTLVGLLLGKPVNSGQLDGVQHASENALENSHYAAVIERIRNLDFAITPNSDTDSRVIERIGEYEIGEQLATGGMGSVYRGRHLRLEKQVAVKVLPERKMQNHDAIARFTREMKIIGQMEHPAMVRATDAGEIDGMHFLVMELVDGLDLGRIVRLHGKLKMADAVEMVRCAAIGLHDAHERGVIHRDVKPSNLMLNRDGSTKILDLGLATLNGLHGQVDELTTVGQLMGTLDYMAPEQCGNQYTVDRRTDVYALGATLYKLLSGTAPYSDPTANTPLKKMKAMATQKPKPILARIPNLDPNLAAIVDQCLEMDPHKRFQSSCELSAALQDFTDGHSLKALLNSAEKLQSQQPVPSRIEPSISLTPKIKTRTPKPTLQTAQPKTPRWQFDGIGRIIAIATAALFFGFSVWGGIVIYLNTTAGRLVIESEIDNIRISVVQNKKHSKEIEVTHGAAETRLGAGQYQITIIGQTDGLTIDNDTFELKRGEKVVARIRREPPDNKRQTKIADSSMPDPSMEKFADTNPNTNKTPDQASAVIPTYKGISLDRYVGIQIGNASNQRSSTRSLEQSSSAKAIQYLLAPTPLNEVERIFHKIVKNHQNEISIPTQKNVVFSLAQLSHKQTGAGTNNLADHVIDYWLKTINRSEGSFDNRGQFSSSLNLSNKEINMMVDALRPLSRSQYDRLEKTLLTRFDGSNTTAKTIMARWLRANASTDSRSQRARAILSGLMSRSSGGAMMSGSSGGAMMGSSLGGASIEPELPNRELSQRLESLKQDKSRQPRSIKWLPLLFEASVNENELLSIEATESLLGWSNRDEVLSQYEKLLDSPHQQVRQWAIRALTEFAPNLTGLDSHLKRAVADGLSPSFYSNIANSPQGMAAIDGYLANLNSQNTQAVQQRIELLTSLHHDANQDRLNESTRNKLAKLMKREIAHGLFHESYQTTAWQTYSTLTNTAVPKLHQGHDLAYWQTKIEKRSLPSEVRIACLKAIKSLVPELTISALRSIASGVQSERLDQSSMSWATELKFAKHAASTLSSREWRNEFLSQIKRLQPKDQPLVLQTLTNLADTENEDLIINYLAGTTNSPNEPIRRQSYYIICKMIKSTKKNHVRVWAVAALTSLAQSKSESIRVKLAALERIVPFPGNTRENFLSKEIVKSMEREKLDLRAVATLFELDLKGGVANRATFRTTNVLEFALSLLRNPTVDLTTPITPMTLDLRLGSQTEKNASPRKSIRLLDQLMEIAKRSKTIGDHSESYIDRQTTFVEILKRASKAAEDHLATAENETTKLKLNDLLLTLLNKTRLAERQLNNKK